MVVPLGLAKLHTSHPVFQMEVSLVCIRIYQWNMRDTYMYIHILDVYICICKIQYMFLVQSWALFVNFLCKSYHILPSTWGDHKGKRMGKKGTRTEKDTGEHWNQHREKHDNYHQTNQQTTTENVQETVWGKRTRKNPKEHQKEHHIYWPKIPKIHFKKYGAPSGCQK